ncbi:MAG: hypothetical protein ACE5OP_05290 [Candidatus Glassbacteria bacterium]
MKHGISKMCEVFIRLILLTVIITLSSIVFSCGGNMPQGEGEGGIQQLAPENIFLGKGENDELIVEAHYRTQTLKGNKLHLRLMLLPTEHFEFEEEYRGFSRISYYKIRKKTKLTIKTGEEILDFKLEKTYTTRSIEPFEIDFERKDMFAFIPDVIDSMALPFKGVARWEKVSRENVGKWKKTKQSIQEEARKRREARRRRKELEKAGEEYSGSDGVWVSVNSTYLFENKDPNSKILAVIPLGTFLEHAKPDGKNWFKITYGDPPVTGFILSLMLSPSQEEAVKWEQQMEITPVATPLEPERDTTEVGD